MKDQRITHTTQTKNICVILNANKRFIHEFVSFFVLKMMFQETEVNVKVDCARTLDSFARLPLSLNSIKEFCFFSPFTHSQKEFLVMMVIKHNVFIFFINIHCHWHSI